MIQVKVRRTCNECERKPDPNCAKCGGTGWVEAWTSLERLARAIRDQEPIEAVVNLDLQAQKWGGC